MSDYNRKAIVDSMSNEEILMLLGNDAAFLQHKINDNIKKYRKLVNSSARRERCFYQPLTYRSAKGFDFVIQFFKRAVGEPEKDKLGIIYYARFMKNRGLHAIMISRLSGLGQMVTWRATIYTPHFFDRYRERFLKDVSMNKVDVIHHFVLNNLKNVLGGHPSEKYPNSVWIRCNDGLCLCSHLNSINLVAKTFVTLDMAGQERQKFIHGADEAAALRGIELSIADEDFNEYTEDVE